jgi:hypothetical protein
MFRNRFSRWRGRPAGLRGRTALAAAVTMAALVAAALTGVFWSSGRVSSVRAANAALSRPLSPRTGKPGRPAAQAGSPARQPAGGAAAHRPAAAPAGQPATRTSCRSVAHIGDSTSVGMVDPAVLPDPAQRLQAQYASVGVRHALVDASGGRSIVEEMPGQVNGYLTARSMASHGFRGCWVIALGTNDTANVSAGSTIGPAARIGQMMSAAHGQPVLWVNTRTLDSTGPWSEANMRLWNAALHQACARYPNLRIFDWASAAKPGWYIPDGIHYTPAGYAARAHAIAGALVKAYPSGGRSTSCVIR